MTGKTRLTGLFSAARNPGQVPHSAHFATWRLNRASVAYLFLSERLNPPGKGTDKLAGNTPFQRAGQMHRALIISICCLSSLTGCAVNQLRRDQDKIRVALLDLYTNQIIDNLIRASNGMPIIQIDYTNATGTITAKQTASFSDVQAATKSSVLALPAATASLTRTIVTTISGGLGAEHTNQVAVTGTPVTTSNEVYDAYLEFLSYPDSLVVSCDPPPPGAAHICKECGGMFYWVPVEYRKEFFRLSLLTTAQRGKALSTPDDFYTVTLQKVTNEEDGQFDTVKLLTVELDKKIPTDVGTIKLTFDNTEVQYDIKPYEPEDGSSPSEANQVVLVLDLTRSKDASTVAAFEEHLPMTGEVYLLHHQPKPPTTEELLQRVNFQLQQIQFNQLRQPASF